MDVVEVVADVCGDCPRVAGLERGQVRGDYGGGVGGYPQTSWAVAYTPWS
jgi:hypothetical protein